MTRRVLAGILVLALVSVLAAFARARWDDAHRTDLQRAMSLVPMQSKRVAFTDWSAVRRQLGVPTQAQPTPSSVARWMGRAYNADLSAASSINDSPATLQRLFGFSPGNADWEAYAQAPGGSAMVLRLADAVNFDNLASTLAALGYVKPSSPTGVWRGGIRLITSLDPTLSPELQYVSLLADQHLVVTSDAAGYAALASKVASGHGATLGDVPTLSDMVSRLKEPAAAMIWPRDFACSDLAMAQADADSQRQADQLIAQAGTVSPLSGLVMALAPDRTLTVAEEFDSSGQADENLRARARLAVGDAVGRGESTFSDDLRLTSSQSVDSTVLLTLQPRRPGVFPLSSLYDGPVIFATC